jgi:hypothetical protein
MKYKHIVTLLQYLLLAMFIVSSGHAIDALATDDSETDRDIMEKALPPIDRNTPGVFDTASFGLG